MTRRLSITAAIAATVALTGCATFTDNDVVASVGDADLTADELRSIAGDLVDDSDELVGRDARSFVSAFVTTELLNADLDALGVEAPTADTSELSAGDAFGLRYNTAVEAWTSLDADVLVDDVVRLLYEQGGEASGIVCATHILVSDRDEAARIVGRLDDGADFAELAAAYSIDPSATSGGELPCMSPADFEANYGPEFAAATADAEIGIPVGPVETERGFHVVRLLPIDELPADAAIPLRVRTLDDRYDISVDPRYGEWNPEVLIAPVG